MCTFVIIFGQSQSSNAFQSTGSRNGSQSCLEYNDDTNFDIRFKPSSLLLIFPISFSDECYDARRCATFKRLSTQKYYTLPCTIPYSTGMFVQATTVNLLLVVRYGPKCGNMSALQYDCLDIYRTQCTYTKRMIPYNPVYFPITLLLHYQYITSTVVTPLKVFFQTSNDQNKIDT